MFKNFEVSFAPACILMLTLLTLAMGMLVSIVDNVYHEPIVERSHWLQPDGSKVYTNEVMPSR